MAIKNNNNNKKSHCIIISSLSDHIFTYRPSSYIYES